MSANLTSKTGLALSGGGAKGAYHVGVLKALAELGILVDAVSGASIGALNGAIVSTAGSLVKAHKNLDKIWQTLGHDKVIAMSDTAPLYLGMLASLGVASRAMPVASTGALVAARIAEYIGLDISPFNGHLLDDSHLVKLLEDYIRPEKLNCGLPFYVSVYETEGGFQDLANVVKALFRMGNTRNSEYFHIQSLPDAEMQELLMASAALPVLFRAREIRGKRYTDGGQGDWYGGGGNTPVKPLVDAGCNTVIVVHLSDGSLWDRSLYRDVNIIEIRPQSNLLFNGGVSDVLGFDARRIDLWTKQGYDDGIHCLKRVFGTIGNVNDMARSRIRAEASLCASQHTDDTLKNAMNRIP